MPELKERPKLDEPTTERDKDVCHLEVPYRLEDGELVCSAPEKPICGADVPPCTAVSASADAEAVQKSLGVGWWRKGICAGCGGPLCEDCIRIAKLWEEHGIWEGAGPRPPFREGEVTDGEDH